MEPQTSFSNKITRLVKALCEHLPNTPPSHCTPPLPQPSYLIFFNLTNLFNFLKNYTCNCS